MLRALRWVALGLAAVVGLYALAGAMLSSRYDRRVAAFRASQAHADLERRSVDVAAAENAVSMLPELSTLLDQVPYAHAYYRYPWAWDADELEKVLAPREPTEDGEEAFDPYERQRIEIQSAMPALDPFVAALQTALQRPAVQYWKPRSEDTQTLSFEAFRLPEAMLPFRAKLIPERAAETADLLLRLSIRWRARDQMEVPETVKAFIDHGSAAETLTRDLAGARRQIARLAELGIDFEAVTRRLQEEGVTAFAKPFRALLDSIATKIERLS